jgi:cell volume regulation protein A
VYVLAKELHLPALIFIMIFGIFLNNLDQLKRFSFISWLEPQKLEKEVHRFREIVAEITFLVRTIFFLVFGFMIDADALLQPAVWALTFIVLSVIFVARFIQLKCMHMPLVPFLFVAPRGLITILLFLSIPAASRMAPVNSALMLQVVLVSSLVLMSGLLIQKAPPVHEAAAAAG